MNIYRRFLGNGGGSHDLHTELVPSSSSSKTLKIGGNLNKNSHCICNSYNTGTRALPDIYARRPRASAYISGKARVPVLYR